MNLFDEMFNGTTPKRTVQGADRGQTPQPYQPGIKIGDDRYRAQIALYREWQMNNPEKASEYDFNRWQREVMTGPTADNAAPGTPGPATPPSMQQPYAPPSERPPASMTPAGPPIEGMPPGVSFNRQRY